MNSFLYRIAFSISLLWLSLSGLCGCGFMGIELIKDYPGKSDEIHYCKTKDGWRLALSHYCKGKACSPNIKKAPIILCHGLGYNHHFWDLDDSVNFARTLAQKDYDVWLLSLRGAGLSTKPGISVLKNLTDMRKGELKSASFAPSKLNWNIDDYIQYDIPAALDYVTSYTKKPRVIWIGHSLGGMIMYGYLGLKPDPKVQALVTLGSPLIIPQPPNNILQAFAKNNLLFKTLLIVNTRSGATGIAPFYEYLITPDKVLFYNQRNMDSETIGKVLEFVVEDLPIGVVNQIIDMVRTGTFRSIDGTINYTELASNITIPALVCCGKADNLAPPESVRFAYHTIGSEDKTFKMFGTANGHKNDYGHNDLILGKFAKKEVYPEILRWVKGHCALNEKNISLE